MKKRDGWYACAVGVVFCLAVVAEPLLGQDSVRVGDKAPDFTLPAATKDTIMFHGINLASAVKNSPVILAFFPAAGL